LLNPGFKQLTLIVQDDSFREFEFRQYIFACQAKVGSIFLFISCILFQLQLLFTVFFKEAQLFQHLYVKLAHINGLLYPFGVINTKDYLSRAQIK
jgi:hypothetical protein